LAEFRLPTEADYDQSAGDKGWLARGVARLGVSFGAMASAVGGCLFLMMIPVVWMANFASCFESRRSTHHGPIPRPLVSTDSVDARFLAHFRALTAVMPTTDSIRIWILDDTTINAASFGDGRFVAWRGLAALPDSTIEAVFAHELGHDILRHSRKVSEVADVTDFIGEVASIFTGADANTTRTLKRWSGAFVIPRYSRTQELQADSAAVGILRAAGYPNPAAAVCSALLTLRSRAGESGGGFFDSHPALSERVKILRGYTDGGDPAACRL
jgi:Zn-dependent protease with chaperone function